LVAFRHFYNKNEPTEIAKVHNILKLGAVKLRDDAMLGELQSIKDRFDKSPLFGLDIYSTEGVVVKRMRGSEILDLYLNSRYFHTDVKGLQYFTELPERDLERGLGVLQLCLMRYIERLKAYVPIAIRILGAKVLPKGYADAGDFGREQAANARRSEPHSLNSRGFSMALTLDLLPEDLGSALAQRITRDSG